MILSTMNDLPGYEVTEVLGEVFGITVRSRHVGSQLGAGFKSLVGGELRGMTKMLSDSRTEAQDRLPNYDPVALDPALEQTIAWLRIHHPWD